MGYILYVNDNDYPGYHVEYIVDTRADMANVPTDKAAPGSSCLVTEDSSVWVLNTQRRWVEI